MEETRISLRNAGKINPECLDDYIAAGGYRGLEKARSMDPAALIEEIENAGKLRGRGGAGFSTGFKWHGAFSTPSDVKYVVCNADEGEPGTFKDRTILESDPHTVLEGILICACAIGAQDAFVYVRGEYTHCIELLRKAAKDAGERGLCGGTSLHIVSGAGSYVCGEETTLLTSLEGYRGEPRLKPPFPTVAGYLGKPTVVNNVETFAAVPVIVENGSKWFSAIGNEKFPGTKIFCLSGDIKKRGAYEVATDAKLRDIIDGLGGGVRDGHRIKAVQMGGGSCGFLKPEQLDVPIDFDSMRAAGSSLGSGAILVLDETHDMAELSRSIARFFAGESCGKCIPCREGTFRLAEILDELMENRGSAEQLALIRSLKSVMTGSCFCPLGQGAANAVVSAMDLFPEDFEKHFGRREEKRHV